MIPLTNRELRKCPRQRPGNGRLSCIELLRWCLALLGDPVALVVLLVLVLHRASSDAVGALLAVLVLGGVVGSAVDPLGVLGEVVPHAVR